MRRSVQGEGHTLLGFSFPIAKLERPVKKQSGGSDSLRFRTHPVRMWTKVQQLEAPQNTLDPDLTQTGIFPEVPGSSQRPPCVKGAGFLRSKKTGGLTTPPSFVRTSQKPPPLTQGRLSLRQESECLPQQIPHLCRRLFLYLFGSTHNAVILAK